MNNIDYLQLFLQYLTVERNLSKNTVLSYGSDLKIFFKYLKSKKKITDLKQITQDDIVEYIMHRKFDKKQPLGEKSIFRLI
ncbi:MAG: site-specific integrase, partial [Elusimicrobiota bacterium]|nr:site-specific integrase [Elusimicrobiota bacterium]